MSENELEIVDQRGGWTVRYLTPPGSNELYFVWELDEAKALEMVAAFVNAAPDETVETSKPAHICAMKALGMEPGQIRRLQG